MSGFVPKRVLNARISSNIEKNQTPMQAGLAPRVGKSGASIRLYYQRVDGCECICDHDHTKIIMSLQQMELYKFSRLLIDEVENNWKNLKSDLEKEGVEF